MNFEKAARPLVMGRNGLVSSGHYLASLAGVKVLQEGGNAVDAALAAAFVMTVVRPETCGPGGDVFALVCMKKSGKVTALNSGGPAPAKASIEYFREQRLDAVPVSGPLSIAVPGAVDGWLELHKRYGTKELSPITADAIRFAREGFPVHQELAERIEEFGPESSWIDCVYRQPLQGLRPGKLLYQRGLGGVLERIATKGRNGFYAGEVAEKICKSLQAEGGLLAEEDLSKPVAQWLEPLSSDYRDYLVYEQPPAPNVSLGSDTTFLCAADRDGNAISLIQSIFAPFGSRVIGGDTGVIMNNQLCSFGLDPSKANSLKPGKRPAHTLNTYMVFKDGEFFAAGGSPGADDQPQTNLQVLHSLLDLGMDPQSAVEAHRWSHRPGTPPRDRLPEELRMEEGFDADIIDALRRKGHKVSVVDRRSFGSAKVIVKDHETGTWMAGADPRREAYALSW